MTASIPKPRWYRLTPDRLVIGLLVVECLLWLSERFQWFGFNSHKGWTVLIAVALVGIALVLMLLWFAVALLFRWRFQFSIRSLLVVVVVVAIPCSWMAVEMKKAREQKEVVEAIKKMGGSVYHDWEVNQTNASPPAPAKPQPPGAAWLRSIVGDDFFANVEGMLLYRTQVTDAGLANLAGLTQLRKLGLDDTKVTGAGLAHLAGLTQLQTLSLGRTEVTDAGLENLQGLTGLQVLSLDDTQITDAGLAHLRGLTALQTLYLHDMKVTDAGVKKLQEALPNSKIER